MPPPSKRPHFSPPMRAGSLGGGIFHWHQNHGIVIISMKITQIIVQTKFCKMNSCGRPNASACPGHQHGAAAQGGRHLVANYESPNDISTSACHTGLTIIFLFSRYVCQSNKVDDTRPLSWSPCWVLIEYYSINTWDFLSSTLLLATPFWNDEYMHHICCIEML